MRELPKTSNFFKSIFSFGRLSIGSRVKTQGIGERPETLLGRTMQMQALGKSAAAGDRRRITEIPHLFRRSWRECGSPGGSPSYDTSGKRHRSGEAPVEPSRFSSDRQKSTAVMFEPFKYDPVGKQLLQKKTPP